MAADYKCTSVGCYDVNSPAMHAKILQLQQLLNRWSPPLSPPNMDGLQFMLGGFDPIPVDGIIGKKTLTAFLLTSSAVYEGVGDNQNMALARIQYLAINTPEDLIGQIDNVIMMLTQAATDNGAVPVAAPVFASPSTVVNPTTAASALALKNIQALKPATQGSITDAWVGLPIWGKVLLVVGGVAGTGYAIKRYRMHHKHA